MKQRILILVFGLYYLNVFGQYPQTGPNFVLGAQGSTDVKRGAAGVSGSLTVLWPSSKTNFYTPNNWVVVGKLHQIKEGSNSLFRAFDKSNSNLSTASLMIGYRVELGNPLYDHKIYDPGAAFYVQGLIGGVLVGRHKTSPTIGADFGIYLSPRFSVTFSGQVLQDADNSRLIIVGLGASLEL